MLCYVCNPSWLVSFFLPKKLNFFAGSQDDHPVVAPKLNDDWNSGNSPNKKFDKITKYWELTCHTHNDCHMMQQPLGHMIKL